MEHIPLALTSTITLKARLSSQQDLAYCRSSTPILVVLYAQIMQFLDLDFVQGYKFEISWEISLCSVQLLALIIRHQ